MAPKDENNLYDTLTGGTDVPAAEGDFSLEEILAEYGGSRGQQLMRDVEAEANPGPEPVFQQEDTVSFAPVKQAKPEKPQPPKKPDPPADPEAEEFQRTRNKLISQAVDLDALEAELPRAPRPISLEEVVGSTVDAVMEENKTGPLLERRRGLFSRRKLAETEELYAAPREEEPEEEEEEEEVIGPEPDLFEAGEDCRDEHHRWASTVPAAFCLAMLPVLVLAGERQGVVIPYWTGQPKIQCLVLLACLALCAILCRPVFGRAVRTLARKRCTSDVLAAVSLLVSAADCVARLTMPDRSDAMPYAPVACMAMAFALWGGSQANKGMFHTFHTAAVDDDPPYLVTETDRGACKQKGTVPGFYTTAMRDDWSTVCQTLLLPVVLVASIVFAGLSSLGQGRGSDFLLNWSAILVAGATFALPLCWALPFSRLAGHLQKTGCAVAGWTGADRIGRRKGMILTDSDLFPPGTIQLNGVKVFGEELPRAASYAAALAQAADCGLQRLFDGLVRSEGGQFMKVDDFSFYEEGGYSGTIRGETVLLGTASFMRKMDVRLPGGINLKTGVFLAVDRQLIAVFAVKYNAAENVDFALRMMRRSHITPILAARDPNITPALLRRKFHKGVKVEYPDLTARVALSEAEKDRGIPRALLFREGLMPYAETVAGSRRLCKAVRRAVALSLLGSASGTLLAFYLVFNSAYNLLTPLALMVFLLLWTVPVLLMADWTGRY